MKLPSGQRSRRAMAVAAAAVVAAAGCNGSSQGGRGVPRASTVDRLAATASTHVTSAFFGMHVLHPALGWPMVPVGTYRIWDNQTTWRDLEPTRGTWNWTQLDSVVDGAQARSASVELVLGQTPAWASSLPRQRGLYGAGATAPPMRMSDWTTYVRTVASRYRGRIEAYEIWNEPNWQGEYYGSPQRLAALTSAAARAIKSVDPQALVVSPSFVVSDTFDNVWLSRFLSSGGADSTDVIAIHGYPAKGGAPEQALQYMTDVFKLLDRHHVRQPVWDTEYNLRRTGRGPLAAQVGGLLLARSYLLAASYGIARLYWYAWGDRNFGAVEMATAHRHPTAAARDYVEVRRWLLGSTSRGCEHKGTVWTCTFVHNHKQAAAVWSTHGVMSLRVAKSYRWLTRLGGVARRIRPGESISLTASPLWLTS
jgi:hypothetical protein